MGPAASCTIFHKAKICDRVGLSGILGKKEPVDRLTQCQSVCQHCVRLRRINFRLPAKTRHCLLIDKVEPFRQDKQILE
ncbi:hypothetical protein ATY75_27715 [Rhizobium sp. N122]|nr:hypothetical protein ATY75_27715 [Rhizobium sp. N122]